MKKVILCLIVILMLFGCGGSSSDSNAETDVETESMELSNSYTLYEGDRIVKETSNSSISIIQTENSDSSEVILISGSAHIIRG